MFRKNARAQSGERHLQDMEERLTAYYGPALPPQALSEATWFRLRAQLEQVHRAPSSRPARFHAPLVRPRRERPVPVYLQEQFASLLTHTDTQHLSPSLSCHFSARPIHPRVKTSPFGGGRVYLMLPRANWQALQTVELEVLLAVGLARCARTSRALFLLTRALFAASLALMFATFPFASTDRRSLWIFCGALACCAAGACVINWQVRALVFQGDRQAVQWLGRERVCQGLHRLAEHSSSRHRSPWGEPSLVERIARVCGTSATKEDEHLTLVG